MRKFKQKRHTLILRTFHSTKIYRYVESNIKLKKKIAYIIKEKDQYLLNGKYILSKNRMINMILVGNPAAKKFMKKNTAHLLRKQKGIIKRAKKIVRNTIDRYFTLRIDSKKDKKNQGSLIMLTGRNNIKIFDFVENKVLTFYEDKREYEEKKFIYMKFRDYFNIPISYFEDYERVSIEERIELIPFENISEKILQSSLEKIFKDYIDYFNNTKTDSVSIYRKEEVIRDISYIKNNELKKLINELVLVYWEDINFPRIEVHGDLNYQNILFDLKEMFYIDWEFSKPLIFYFDIINLIFIEASSYSNYTYINNYITGSYDNQISELFTAFGLEFNKKRKLFYLAVFLVDCIKNKDSHFYKGDTHEVEVNYLLTLKQIMKQSEYDNF